MSAKGGRYRSTTKKIYGGLHLLSVGLNVRIPPEAPCLLRAFRAPRKWDCKEPRAVFFVVALLPENRSQILASIFLSADLSASKRSSEIANK